MHQLKEISLHALWLKVVITFLFLLKINNIVGTVTTCHGSSKWSNTRLVFWGFDQENNSLNQLKYSNVICNKWVYGGSLTQR